MVEIKRLPAFFYTTAGGKEPVREWLRKLDDEDRRIVGQDIALAEFGWPVGMPVCRQLGNSLYEIRSDLTQGRSARVIFCLVEGRMVLLHGFMKKTQKTPLKDFELALRRMREVTHA